MRLVVFGAGYIGLVSGAGLAELGHDVRIVDIDPERVKRLSDGVLPIYEPSLADLIRRNERNGRLSFSSEIGDDFVDADVYFICVGTPPDDRGDADISAVLAVADTIAKSATKPALIAVKSTVPVGTCDAVEQRVASATTTLEVVSNPEFLKEGDAVADFFKPDRIILGADTDGARRLLRELYGPLQLSGERLVITDRRSSELIKYASNAMLAMRVSFMNELSRLCHATGADIHAVRLGVGADTRIGRKFLYAGPGYGGACFPKDVQALTHLGQRHGVPMRLAEATHRANREQIDFVCNLIADQLGESSPISGKIVAIWGLAFKPETDDVREAPSIDLAKFLLARGVRIVAHDPEASGTFSRALVSQSSFPNLGELFTVAPREYDAVTGADALVLLTEWRNYRAPNFKSIKKRMRGDLVFDARNIWRAAEVRRAGLRYQGIGVNPNAPPSIVG